MLRLMCPRGLGSPRSSGGKWVRSERRDWTNRGAGYYQTARSNHVVQEKGNEKVSSDHVVRKRLTKSCSEHVVRKRCDERVLATTWLGEEVMKSFREQVDRKIWWKYIDEELKRRLNSVNACQNHLCSRIQSKKEKINTEEYKPVNLLIVLYGKKRYWGYLRTGW